MYFTIFSGLSGAMLASFIRLELAYPGSHFFKGDSVRYIQVISSHGLVMIFYVVVPIVFGLFANYFIPFHILAKDVSFPRLNSIGFWLLPAGFLLMAKPAFSRRQVYKFWDPYDAYRSVTESILKNFVEIMASEDYGVAVVKHKIKYSHLNEIFSNVNELATIDQLTHLKFGMLENQKIFNTFKKELVSSSLENSKYNNQDKSDFIKYLSELDMTELMIAVKYINSESTGLKEKLCGPDLNVRLTSIFSKMNLEALNSLEFIKYSIKNFSESARVVPNNITLAKAIKGRMSQENDNLMGIIQN